MRTFVFASCGCGMVYTILAVTGGQGSGLCPGCETDRAQDNPSSSKCRGCDQYKLFLNKDGVCGDCACILAMPSKTSNPIEEIEIVAVRVGEISAG